MATHNVTGKQGEVAAITFLKQKGYKILKVNWKYRKLEIDIIAEHNNLLVIAEVKTRGEGGLLEPEKAVTKTKQKNLIKAANAFIVENNIDKETRFDILSISKSEAVWEINHIEDAFYPLL